MSNFVSAIFFLSLVYFTVQQNVTTYSPTSRSSTQDGNHDTLGLSTTIIDRVHNTLDQTSNTNSSFHANEENKASSQNASAEKEFNGDTVPGYLSVVGIKKWDKVDALLKLQAREMLENLNVKDAVTRANASGLCKSSLELYFNALSDLETWSVKMADATGKISGGVLDGRFMSFGSYEECLKVRVDSSDHMKEFRGQYCLSKFRSPLLNSLYLKNGSLNRQYVETYGEPPPWIKDFILRMGPYLKYQVFSLGTCVPSTCSDQDLTQVITQIVSPIGMSVEVSGCQVEKPITWTKSLIAAVSVLSSIATLCILGSVIDIANRVSAKKVQEEDQSEHSENTMMKLLKMFSVPSNVEILVNGHSSGSFGCLGGIRFFSATWVVLNHTYVITSTWFFNKFSNAMAFKEDFSDSLPLAAIDNVSIAIVSFFFISGFLMSYFMWRKLEKGNGDLNFIKFFLHKYWRLTPCIVLTLAVYVVVVQTVSGPLWNMEHGMEMCHSNWWKTFLFIANWWKWNDICLIHTWFVCCLMQFHVIGFIIIQITFRWPAVGVLMGVVIVLGCCGLVVTVAVLKNISLPTTMAQKDFDIVQIWRSWFKYNTFYYMQSYAIGMLVGYLVLKHKGKKISQRYQTVGWILSLMGSSYAVYGIQGPENNPLFTGFYYAFSFFAWSASLGWFIYACIAGYGGMVNRFLSWKGFHLLGSISYLIYLLHVILHFTYYNNNAIKEVVHYGHYEMMSTFLSTLVISTFLAFVGHVTVEMPFNHLEKHLFSR